MINEPLFIFVFVETDFNYHLKHTYLSESPRYPLIVLMMTVGIEAENISA